MPVENENRLLIAIGDLHGDYYRLLRILSEQNLINKNTLKWNLKANNVDLVFIGDYIDWRGEPLEGEPGDLHLGSGKILYFLKKLHKDLKSQRSKKKNFKSKIYLVLGNHDEMMLESLKIFKEFSSEQINFILENAESPPKVKKFISESNLNNQQVDVLNNFLNWYFQGGDKTIESFGDLNEWRKALEGDLGKFLKKNLKIAVVINKNFFSHSVPDEKKYWKKLKFINKDLKELSKDLKEQLKKAFLWGRKIAGYNFLTGLPTALFTEEEINDLLGKLDAERAIIGHTPTRSLNPVHYYGGKVINIDLHGKPGSEVYVEKWGSEPKHKT